MSENLLEVELGECPVCGDNNWETEVWDGQEPWCITCEPCEDCGVAECTGGHCPICGSKRCRGYCL